MSGTKPALTGLQARKQLLLLESEMNRVQLGSDYVSLHQEVSSLWHAGRSLVATAGSLLTGFKTLRQLWSAKETQGKLPLVMQLLSMATSFWMMKKTGKK